MAPQPVSDIRADFDEPILFRTVGADVYEKTLRSGSLWLRSDQYFRELEDEARKDSSEGVNAGRTVVPLRLAPENAQPIQISGHGHIGRQIVPHYILSLHGSSISPNQHRAFGECTFGVRSITRLSAEVLYKASLRIKSVGYRYGQVSYQYAALSLSHSARGDSAIQLDGQPPVYLNPLSTDVLRKIPVMPFIEQDEWRIVIFTDGYHANDPAAPLTIDVDPAHFYPYLKVAA